MRSRRYAKPNATRRGSDAASPYRGAVVKIRLTFWLERTRKTEAFNSVTGECYGLVAYAESSRFRTNLQFDEGLAL